MSGLQLALDVVLFIMAVMGGRVMPMFTNNGVPGANARAIRWWKNSRWAPSSCYSPPTAAIAAVGHRRDRAGRARWRTARACICGNRGARLPRRSCGYCTRRMHGSSCIWCCAGCPALDLLADGIATHALTIGAIGGMTLGMMTRTARGHTGRPLVADRFEVAMFVLIQVAAVARVFGGIASPGLYMLSIQLSGLLWAAAFGLYAVRYWPVLTRPGWTASRGRGGGAASKWITPLSRSFMGVA